MKIGLVIDENVSEGVCFYQTLEPVFQAFSDAGNEVYFIQPGYHAEVSDHVVTLPYFSSSLSSIFSLKLAKNSEVILSSLNLDVIHFLNQSPFSKMVGRFAEYSCLPLVLTINPYELDRIKHGRLFLYDSMLRLYSYFIHRVLDNQGVLSYHLPDTKCDFRNLGFTESITGFSNVEELAYLYERAKMQNI